MNPPGAFLQSALLQLVRRWWRAGRIRVSPREGELLRLRSGDIVEFEGHRLEVDSWSFREEPPPADAGQHDGSGTRWRLQLDCRNVGGEATEPGPACRLLIVPAAAKETDYCGSPQPPVVWLQEAGQPPRQLMADDLSVWCRQ